MSSFPNRPGLRLLHLSDVHVGLSYGFPAMAGEEQGDIPLVVLSHLAGAARREDAELVVIAGDFFDHNRIGRTLVRKAWESLDACPCPVVILPGNHDPYMDGSPYLESRPAGIHVISRQEGELLEFAESNAEVWGQAHTGYEDFDPCGEVPRWSGDAARWRIAMAHGHFIDERTNARFTYQIRPSELSRLDADYVALGHWDFLENVPAAGAGAWYSGSPCRTHSFTRIDLSGRGIAVTAVPILP